MRTCVQVSVAMDAKDLRTESALSERNNDSNKYSQSGGIALHCDRNKSYQDIGSNSLPKVEVQNARPCAVIGPDRVVPPTVPNESYIKKGPSEPWPCMDNTYHTRRPPEYPHKLANFQNPTRNISPRQTFQENMQRIMVPPSYNSVKICEDTNYTQITERSNVLPKNIKINVPSEAKFCDVPYTVFPPNNEQKNVRNPDMCLPNVNPNLTRTAPHGWPGSVNIRPSRTYGVPEVYQYQDYTSCAGPRPVVPRPNRTGPEDPGYLYADPFYHQEGNIRFKPYPTVKERFPQQRYDYVSNYANSFHPQPTFPSHKYELQKPVPPHSYGPYPPIKYLDRVSDPVIDGYQRNQQASYNISYRNPIIHPNFGSVVGSCPQNKIHSYPPDGHIKTVGPNKIPYENAKGYIEYESARPKMYPQAESYLVNEMGRMHPMKSQVIMPNYASLSMHNIPPNQYYKKDSQPIKNYEYVQAHFRTMDPSMNMHNPMARHPPVFSPNALAISPTDSSASNDTSQVLGTTPQEDCGYVSQSSTASVRSVDSGMNRMPNDYIRKYYDSRFGPIIRSSTMMSKSELISSNDAKEKKNIDVRQFLQMWNEGDEETEENNPKGIIQAVPKSDGNFSKTHEVINQANQEQLYVLGLVNVPSEELGKYEHIQKVSKLPENIKGYNHIELLNQFEEAIESSNITNYKTSKDFQIAPKIAPHNKGTCALPSRPLSPLDVEAKISQSVIHKEVGCNFEIKPCSPKMLNVEVATPVQNILSERVIEKVANPVMLKSPRLSGVDENIDCNIMKRKDHRLNITDEAIRIPSCKMVNTQFSNNIGIDTIKNSYSLQDLESNSGICLASLPRLDNDIELNFPEVNQQFINANKRDSGCLTTSPRDLPSLEVLEQSDNQSAEKLNDLSLLTRDSDNRKSPCAADSEKEFTKLSKYRKTRAPPAISKENIHALRTDSVIIKNPENVKNYEDHTILSPNPQVKQSNEIQQAPINLTSQGYTTENSNNMSFITKQHDTNKEADLSLGIAIDFSLKNISNDNDQSMEVDIGKETEVLPHKKSETCNSILDEHSLKIPTYSESNQNHCTNHEKVAQNILNPEPYINTLTVNAENSIDVVPLDESFTKNEYGSSVTNINESTEEYLSSVPCVKDVDSDNNNSLLPMDFVTPPVELLQTTDSNNYSMEIDKNIENPMNHLVHSNTIETSCTEIEEEKIKNREEHILVNSDTYPKEATLKTIKETIISESNIDGPKDDINELLRVTEFSKIKNSDSQFGGNIKLEEEQRESVAILKSDATEEDIENYTFTHLTCNSTNNYNLETIDGETHSNIDSSSSNNVIEQSNSEFPSESAEQKSASTIDNSPTNKYNENEVTLEKSEQKSIEGAVTESVEGDFFSNFNIPSPNNIVINKDDNPPETTNREDDPNFDIASLESINMDSQNDISSLTTKAITVSNINLSSSNNISKPDLRQSDTNSNETDVICLNKLYDGSNIVLNDMEGKREDFFKVMADDVKDTLSITSSENSLIVNDELQLTHNSTVELNVKYIQRGIRYLSYGSKEMYSPTIQKLIMFCEGNTYNLNTNFDNEIRSVCSLSAEEKEGVSVMNKFSNGSDSTSTDNCISEVQMQFGDISLVEKHLEGKVHENNYESTEVTDKTTESDKSYSTDTLQNHEESDIQGECKDTDQDLHATSWPINVKNTICNLKNSNSDNNEQVSCNVELVEQDSQQYGNDKETNKSNEEIYQQLEEKLSHDEVNVHSDKDSNLYNELPEQREEDEEISNTGTLEDANKESNRTDEMTELWDRQCNNDHEVNREQDKQSNCSNEVLNQNNEEPQCNNVSFETIEKSKESQQSNYADEIFNECDRPNDKSETLNELEQQSNCADEIFNECGRPSSNCADIGVEPSIAAHKNDVSCTKLQSTEHAFLNNDRQPLKRSLSDSALNVYNNNESSHAENEERLHFIWPFKRRKMNSVDNDVLARNLCNIIQSNRRNSISSIYNEENVSFCILIDNSCIISEEENDEQDKICYTELSEECLAEVQNDCEKDNADAEIVQETISTPEQEENHCEYSDSYVMECEDGKLEESWVEDIACVETVISDDIAEDIEISGPSSPKDEDDTFSDNDESGVFSSSEHTDKVKYIYGDKMCNDDAQFVETLYNTPQMDVNKTLIQRETLRTGEYYDNDSLEKILSESTDQAPYVSAYSGIYSPRIINVKQTLDTVQNMDLKSKSPIENIGDAVDAVDTGYLKIAEEPENHEFLNKTQDDTIHSCESSIDNVFTYRENDDNARYITSSSPEVSSTTSEEKSSAILLKITNYKGSRISQINETSKFNKSPSCKFTEDKDYVQSHANFPSHRPLLTKAAQKYIPPLKESIRDLKVKLSLPQHSLIKLKQLKKSKDEPKVCKQSISVPKISMKPKPKFEDVLKSIDEIQFKMHKEKTKKSKKSIPKVVIKKNENGSHYASTSNKTEFNPDLTGRKWQPWVFIEKNHFIDKMAIKKKTKAIYSHRKRTYVLAEKFQKYKSVSSATKFVISPPLSDCPSAGLKYTIRLKHNY